MAQRSIEHSARLDESLAAEADDVAVGVPVDIAFEVPDEDDGEAELHAVEAVLHAPVAGALGDEERKRRSELAAVLHPNAFPAERDALIHVAREEGAAEWMLELLERLPIDTRFDTVQDVWLAIGGHREDRTAPFVSTPSRSVDRKPATPVADTGEPTDETDRTRSERSGGLIALGILGWVFDGARSVVRGAASSVQRLRRDRQRSSRASSGRTA